MPNQPIDKLIHLDLLKQALIIMDNDLKENKSPMSAFITTVLFVKSKSNLSKSTIEKSLIIYLSGIYDDAPEQNPFKDLQTFIMLPWYTKLWWNVQDSFKANKTKFAIAAFTILAVLALTNPSHKSYKEYVSMRYNLSPRYVNYAMTTGRKYNFFFFSIYQNSRSKRQLGILSNFFDL